MNILTFEKQIQAIAALTEGNSIRATDMKKGTLGGVPLYTNAPRRANLRLIRVSLVSRRIGGVRKEHINELGHVLRGRICAVAREELHVLRLDRSVEQSGF